MAKNISDSDFEDEIHNFLTVIEAIANQKALEWVEIPRNEETRAMSILHSTNSRSLSSFCLEQIKKLHQYVNSLKGVPNAIIRVISNEFCYSNMMNPTFFNLFFTKSPSEI